MIRVVFTASESWLGRVIRWITKSRVSHVMIEYPSTLWGGQWIAEATVTGVRKVPAKRAKHHVVAEYECTFPIKVGIAKVAKYVGTPYDYAGLLVFAWAIIAWRVLKKKIRKPLNNTKGQFCSEFVTRFFIACCLPGTETWDPEKSSPQRLFNYCEKRDTLFQKLDK